MVKADISDFASMQFEKFRELASCTHNNDFKEFHLCKHRLNTF